PTPVEIWCFQQLSFIHAARHGPESHFPSDLGLVAIQEFLGTAPTNIAELVALAESFEILKKSIATRAGVQKLRGGDQLFKRLDAGIVVDLWLHILVEGVKAFCMEAHPPLPCDEILSAVERPTKAILVRLVEERHHSVELLPGIRDLELVAVLVSKLFILLGIVDPVL